MKETLPVMNGEIVGHGDIAQALREADLGGKLFFASGVSNSQETRESEYQREKDLLLAQDRTRHIVYFGSLSIYYKDSRYTQHKREMEELVRQNFPSYTIVRIGNIDWGTNPHTLINYLRAQHARGEPMRIEDTYRYVVDKAHFIDCINGIPDNNCEINLEGRKMKISEIVKEYVL